jgi:2-polyprenyl-3-methyl-5-hydroxy-6-metoxy-1,4-benzoquinol methylase
VGAFYDVNDYYTHDAGEDVSTTFSDRLLRRAAWTFDHSVDTDERWVRHTFGRKPRRLLEIGAGDGDLAATLAAYGHDVTCVELDPVGRDRIWSRGLVAYDGTAEAPPAELEPGSFDGVLLFHVLEHTIDPGKALANAARFLKPGGVLVVEVPNNLCVGFSRQAFSWAFFDVPRHLSFFVPQSLRRAVEHAGLAVVREEMRGFTRQYLPEWLLDEQHAHDALASAGAPSLPRRSTRADAWRQLAEALTSSKERRYDSVRVVAHKG